MNAKKLAIVSVALVGVLAAASVEARGRDDVQFSVTIGSPAWTTPVYRQAPVAQYHGRTYREPTRWDRDGDGIPNRYDRVYNPRWDRDGDGLPNRYDRHDNPRHDRDGRATPRW